MGGVERAAEAWIRAHVEPAGAIETAHQRPWATVLRVPRAWLVALPLYAELQRGEAAHARDHLAHGVPDLRVATLRSRTRSRRWWSPSGSSRSATSWHRATRGSRGSGMHIWSRGVAAWPECSPWRSASAPSRTPSPGRSSGTTCPRQRAPSSTGPLRSDCVVRSPEPSNSASAGFASGALREQRLRRRDRGDALELAHGHSTCAGAAWGPQELR